MGFPSSFQRGDSSPFYRGGGTFPKFVKGGDVPSILQKRTFLQCPCPITIFNKGKILSAFQDGGFPSIFQGGGTSPQFFRGGDVPYNFQEGFLTFQRGTFSGRGGNVPSNFQRRMSPPINPPPRDTPLFLTYSVKNIIYFNMQYYFWLEYSCFVDGVQVYQD